MNKIYCFSDGKKLAIVWSRFRNWISISKEHLTVPKISNENIQISQTVIRTSGLGFTLKLLVAFRSYFLEI